MNYCINCKHFKKEVIKTNISAKACGILRPREEKWLSKKPVCFDLELNDQSLKNANNDCKDYKSLWYKLFIRNKK